VPFTVKTTLFLLSATALGWLVFGVMSVFHWLTFIPVTQVRMAIGGIAIGCSMITGAAVYFLYHRNKYSYYFTVTLLVMSLTVSFMDELGLTDAMLIGITVFSLIFLIKDRNWYLLSK
jgi:hypothetical protein